MLQTLAYVHSGSNLSILESFFSKHESTFLEFQKNLIDMANNKYHANLDTDIEPIASRIVSNLNLAIRLKSLATNTRWLRDNAITNDVLNPKVYYRAKDAYMDFRLEVLQWLDGFFRELPAELLDESPIKGLFS